MRKPTTAFLLSLALATAQAANVPGAIPGSFGVSETGAATYSVPIAVPPGTAGMEPKLSLNYSSQGGNGIAGVGWSLGGLSAITRCPQTIVHDGQTRGVQLDANDRFCLDGQRLIVVNGSTYGAVGAQYRTEIESFSKVVSYGGAAGDPQYFKVWTKAGQIIEFGNTADARAEAQGKTVAAAWAVSKVSDTVGNYIAFTYFEDNANSEHRIIRIDYTGNAAASVSPYNTVEFQYEARPDVNIGYIKGSRSQASQRLVKVLTTGGSTVVKDYSLTYEASASTGMSRLASVTECAGNGDCLRPTTFGWQEGQAGLETAGINTGISNANALYSYGVDVDGDGITDLVYPSGTSWKVRFGGSEGFSAEVDTGIANVGYQYARPLDYNADGKMDLMVPYANNRWHLMRATGDRNGPFAAPFDTGVTDSAKTVNPQLADMNGDGLPDLVHAHDGYFYVALGNATGLGADGSTGVPLQQARPINGTTYYWYYKPEYARIGDVDGDGLGDLMSPYLRLCYSLYYGFYNCNAYWHYVTKTRPGTSGNDLISTSQGYSQFTDYIYDYLASTSNGIPQTHLNQQTGDINGDGLSDILTVGWNGSAPVWWLCQGTGSTPLCSNTNFTASGSQAIRAMDYNADGFADYLVGPYANGHFYVFQSNRTGFNLVDSGIPDAGYDQNPVAGDFNGDGLMDVMLAHDGAWYLHVHKGAVPDLLLVITDGLGATHNIAYKPLTDPNVYTKGVGSAYPVQDVQNATHVVAETAADDGIGGSFRNAYRYADARIHLTGRGFLGFATLEQADLQTGIVTRTTYSQAFPTIGMPVLSTKTSAGGVELARVVNTPASKSLNAGKTYFPYVAYSKEQGKDLNAVILPSTETWNTFDDWGNLTQTISQTSDGFKKQTDNTYTNDATKWFLGRLARASVASTINNSWTLTRVSAFEYDTTTGLLNKETIEPDAASAQFRLDTAYTFDAFGNRKTVVISSPATGTTAIVTRTTTTTYDARGQFPVTAANALGHTESKTFDSRFGVVANLTGPNNLATAWQYDSFGRKTRETRADGTFTQWTYDFCDAACPANGVYRIVTQVFAPDGIQAAPVSVAYFDRLNREVRAATQGFDGSWIYKDTVYDNQGRAQQISRPYFAGQSAYWSTSEYDDLGRVVKVFEPDVPVTAALSVVYNGLTISRTNRKNQTTTEVRNSQGQKVSVTDAMGNVTGYSYDPFGNLAGTTDPVGNQIVNLYDIRGRKTQTTDPDLGLWTYEYDALGELVKQTDAKQQATTFTYDQLGRMTQRVEPGLTSTWVWDGSYFGKGKLKSAKNSLGYVRTHYYDVVGRPFLTVANPGDGTPLLWTTIAYDEFGHISEQYYPSNTGIKNVYNALGYLTEVRNTDTNALYWQLNQMDAEGHVTQETYGSGTVVYTAYLPQNGRFNYRVDNRNGALIDVKTQDYDELGNVASRYQYAGNQGENLVYDALNRLVQVERYGNAPGIDTIAYRPDGNIASKTGVGDYYYGGSPSCAAGSGAGPHAVCKAGAAAYTYDANGNLTAGGGRIVGWTAWNMPGGLIQGGQNTTWLYTPEHERYKVTAAGRTTWYLNPGVHQGGHYERTHYASGTVEHRHTLYGGGAPIGEVLSFEDGSPSQTRYFHSDAQGSITAVTNESGAVLTRYRYDPWGKQALVSGSNTGISQTRQGHTGHEMLDGGLTHMNGRLYDPTLARFISADPIVQAPYNLQSLNRYSYVLNNPLYYTDPTGFSWWTDFRDGFLKPVAAIVAAAWIGPMVFNAVLPSAVGAAGATGLGMSGSVWAGTAIAGAASGAAVGGIAGGIYNGPQGIAQGAKYGAIGGAISGPVAAIYSGADWGVERVAVSSVTGGVSSAAQGGSFADGFRSSAIGSGFRYVYNSVVNYDVDPWAGGGAVDKQELSMPVQGANNFGTAGEVNPESMWGEGGVVSRIANQIPSMNAIAGMHDVFQVRLQEWGGVWARNALNVPGMLPAAGITWMGLRDTPYLTYDTIQQTEKRAR